MDDNNQNRTNPFGAYQSNDGGLNRPRDISSDLWTPISTGVPLQRAGKLKDENETPPAARSQQAQTRKPSQTKGSRAKSKSAAKKKTAAKKTTAKKPAAKQTQPSAAADRPVVRSQPQQKRPADAGRSRQQQQREQRVRKNDERQYERDRAHYETERSAGRSSDDIRRAKARRKRRNKKLRAVITVAAVMVVAAVAALVYCYAYGAPIAKITVSGKTDYTNEEIIAACGVEIGDNMLRVRSRDVSKTLSAALPYIQSAKVDYKLPDTLVVKVTQTKEKYLIVGKKSYLCLSEEGKVLSLKKKKLKDGQYRLEGFDWQNALEGSMYTPEGENVQRYDAAKAIVQALEDNDLTGANILQLSSLHPLVIQYEGRINIYLNGTDDLHEKISLVAGILKNEISQSSKGYIDARFEGRAFFNEGSMSIE